MQIRCQPHPAPLDDQLLLGPREVGVQLWDVPVEHPGPLPPHEDGVLDPQVREQDVGVDRVVQVGGELDPRA